MIDNDDLSKNRASHLMHELDPILFSNDCNDADIKLLIVEKLGFCEVVNNLSEAYVKEKNTIN